MPHHDEEQASRWLVEQYGDDPVAIALARAFTQPLVRRGSTYAIPLTVEEQEVAKSVAVTTGMYMEAVAQAAYIMDRNACTQPDFVGGAPRVCAPPYTPMHDVDPLVPVFPMHRLLDYSESLFVKLREWGRVVNSHYTEWRRDKILDLTRTVTKWMKYSGMFTSGDVELVALTMLAAIAGDPMRWLPGVRGG